MGKLSDEFGKQSKDLLIKAAKSEIAGLQFAIDTHVSNGDAKAADEARSKQAKLKAELAALEGQSA